MIPITVLTITYNRYDFLQEAVASFVSQKTKDCEMLIINDQKNVEYVCDVPNVRIINYKKRFNCIFDKLLFGFANAKNDYVYRLDDDDLLSENMLRLCQQVISANPGYDLYRSKQIQFFNSDTYVGLSGSVNNGNIFTKKYVSTLERKQLSANEDMYMVYDAKPKTYTFDFPSMIYRWGMGTYHISGMGNTDPAQVNKLTDKFNKMENGVIKIKPAFKKNYYNIVRGT